MKKITFGLGATALLFGACAEGPQNTTDDFGYEGTGIEFQIAPLTLDSISDACYSFAIQNGSDQLVVGRGPMAAAAFTVGVSGTAAQTVCASQFGNSDGGDISYVAPCDADLPTHKVTVWVDALCRTGSTPVVKTGSPGNGANGTLESGGICQEIQTYVDPCPSGCELSVTCAENQDTPVTFNFTIMGQADQGFFDVAVNFDDVFCSAKFDTCNTANEPIRLVFDGLARVDTFVAAVACTRGGGTVTDGSESTADTRTHLTHTVATITCDTQTTNLDLSGRAEGNWTEGGIKGALYYGTEQLLNMNKVYTNLAVGIPTGKTCSFEWNVAATQGSLPTGGASNTYSNFGYVSFDLDFVPAGSSSCTKAPLNSGPGSLVLGSGASGGVVTKYSPNVPFGTVGSSLPQSLDGSPGTIL